MKAISIPGKLLQRCYEHGASGYPGEACGVLSGPADDEHALTEFHPFENLLGRLHAEDPQRYPRTPKDGYVLDPQAFLKLSRGLEAAGNRIKVIFHSHVDVGAYFSEEDVKQATWGDEPLYPGMWYLVCGIKERRPGGAIVALFNEKTRAFDEHRLEEEARPR